jgi:L-alanine-DL-glutamate epimerase-like enolase superfamily enzyme
MKAVVRAEAWPIRGGFRIARGARSAAEVVVLELHHEGAVGRAECVPYARYGESPDSVRNEIEEATLGLDLQHGKAKATEMSPGAARNAVDCALWDLEAAMTGTPVWSRAGLAEPPGPVVTMRTVSVGSPSKMGEAAVALGEVDAIKVKVDGGDDLARIAAVHEAVPSAKLIVDPNEGWTVEQTKQWLPELAELGVAVLEQPVRADLASGLDSIRERSVPICADESFHDLQSFDLCHRRYDMINVKLDKSGGLTEALRCVAKAREVGMPVMIGCMVSTSLAIAPALLLTPGAAFIDLDGPLLLESDREGSRHDAEAGVICASPSIWGGG